MNTMIEVLVIVNLILTCITLPFIIITMIELVTFRKSTHQIQYVGADDMDVVGADANEKELNKAFDLEDDFLE